MSFIGKKFFNLNNCFIKIFLILLLTASSKPAFTQESNTSLKSNKIRLAVLDFEANNVSLYAAKAVSEFINTEISRKQEFTIVERNRLNQVFMEHELRMTGAFDTSTAIEIGKLVIADKILIGTLTKTGNIFVISARVVDVNTGKIELSESERLLREEDIELASRILSIKIVNRLANTSYSLPVRTYLQYDERNRYA